VRGDLRKTHARPRCPARRRDRPRRRRPPSDSAGRAGIPGTRAGPRASRQQLGHPRAEQLVKRTPSSTVETTPFVPMDAVQGMRMLFVLEHQSGRLRGPRCAPGARSRATYAWGTGDGNARSTSRDVCRCPEAVDDEVVGVGPSRSRGGLASSAWCSNRPARYGWSSGHEKKADRRQPDTVRERWQHDAARPRRSGWARDAEHRRDGGKGRRTSASKMGDARAAMRASAGRPNACPSNDGTWPGPALARRDEDDPASPRVALRGGGGGGGGGGGERTGGRPGGKSLMSSPAASSPDVGRISGGQALAEQRGTALGRRRRSRRGAPLGRIAGTSSLKRGRPRRRRRSVTFTDGSPRSTRFVVSSGSDDAPGARSVNSRLCRHRRPSSRSRLGQALGRGFSIRR